MPDVIAENFDPSLPVSAAQGRHGELILVQGGGLTPKRWAGLDDDEVLPASNAGIPAPATAPTIVPSAGVRYYVARVDVQKSGSVYNLPPVVTFTADASPAAGFRAASAQSYLDQASVREIRVVDGGKHYIAPPSVLLSATHGTGAQLVAEMDGDPPNPTSITHYEIIQGPPFDDEDGYANFQRTQYGAWGALEIPIANGSHTISRTLTLWTGASKLDPDTPSGAAGNTTTIGVTLSYTVSGATGNGAKAIVNFSGQGIYYAECVLTSPTSQSCVALFNSACFLKSVKMVTPGSGYSETDPITIRINSSGPAYKNVIIEGYPPGHAKNTSTPRFTVKKINKTFGGTGYVVAPDIKITSSSGFGAYATATASGGSIGTVRLESGGGGYKTIPTVLPVSGGAEAFAVTRPHLRGKYQCYYRYVDATPESKGGPIPGNLSPVREVDAGDGKASMTWGVVPPPADPSGSRPLTVELWRTTSNQALMLYRVATGASFYDYRAAPGGVVAGALSFVDDLTDEEVRNPDRAGYAAMPIVLPNGDLNAMRFTPPPADKAVVVRYQDRFWYGVDTSGEEPNALYFSEVDEPESVPDINQFVLQQNSRDTDAISALIPFGTALLVMQSRHAYSVTFAKHPLRDADVGPVANRGCLNQRCWDVHEGACYVMDRYGIYAFSPSKGVQDLSSPIGNLFRDQINFDSSTWAFLAVDPVAKVLRAFVTFKQDGQTAFPTRALCFCIASNTWWMERYPQRISGVAHSELDGGRFGGVYAGQGGAYLLDEGAVDIARGSVLSVTLANRGSGYRTPPSVTAPGGIGAEFQAVLASDGSLSGIWIVNPGFGYAAGGSLVFSAPDDPGAVEPVTASGSFAVSANNADTSVYPVYRYKTGSTEYPTDMNSREGGMGQPRDISVTYKPQDGDCGLAMRLYHNNSPHPRPLAASYSLGVGFAASRAAGASRIDMGSVTARTGSDSGFAKSVFAGRTLDTIASSDRHVAVELLGARTRSEPVVIYELDVYGTARSPEAQS